MKSYFQPHTHYFWEFAEDGEVIAIPYGSTIAYRGLVENTLYALSYQGLPRFGTVLMALAALSEDGGGLLKEIKELLTRYDKSTDKVILNSSIGFLNRLAKVPTEYKIGKMKENLLRGIFLNSHRRIGAKQARKKIYPRFKEKKESEDFIAVTKVDSDYFYADFRPLQMLAEKFPTTKSILAAMLGLPELPEEIELPVVEEPQLPSEPDEDLVERLVDQAQTFQIGSLVRHLWSGFTIPFHSHTPSGRPFGGVSDITNKGDISRLLISEYAQEDIVFLSRLANSEALYLSRESPPATADKQRDILIDITLKNWGVPKILAFASMLAIAHHPKSKMACRVFAVGQELIPIAHEHVKGIVTAVQLVDSSLDASPGLRQYFEENPPNAQTEVFLLTEPTTVKHAAMMQTTQEFSAGINYWLLCDQQGGIDVFRNTNRSRKHLQRLQLPFRKLWEQKRTAAQPALELTFSQYPILLDEPGNHKGIVKLNEEEAYLLIKNCLLKRRIIPGSKLMYYFSWEVVHDDLPVQADVFQMGITGTAKLLLLLWRISKPTIYLLDINSGNSIHVEFAEHKPGSVPEVIFEKDRFIFRYDKYGPLWSLDWETGLEDEAMDFHVFFKDKDQSAIDIYPNQFSKSILVSLKGVHINAEKRLVVNKHQLVFNQQGQIKWRPNHGIPLLESASNVGENQYQFDKGTVVQMKVPGMLSIHPRNPDLSQLFIPTTLDYPIGLGTDEEFTGHLHYYKQQIYWIMVNSIGKKKLETIRAITEIGAIGVQEAKNLVESVPFLIPKSLSSSELHEAQRKLNEIGVDSEMVLEEDYFNELSIVNPEAFYLKHITPMIQGIL